VNLLIDLTVPAGVTLEVGGWATVEDSPPDCLPGIFLWVVIHDDLGQGRHLAESRILTGLQRERHQGSNPASQGENSRLNGW
jgi:hypothetical protein